MPAFRYRVYPELGQTVVFHRGKQIGKLLTYYERGGRHCFQLAADAGPKGRTYRGREIAAGALLVMFKLLTAAKREGWKRDTLIAKAWKCRPESVES